MSTSGKLRAWFREPAVHDLAAAGCGIAHGGWCDRAAGGSRRSGGALG